MYHDIVSTALVRLPKALTAGRSETGTGKREKGPTEHSVKEQRFWQSRSHIQHGWLTLRWACGLQQWNVSKKDACCRLGDLFYSALHCFAMYSYTNERTKSYASTDEENLSTSTVLQTNVQGQKSNQL